MRKILTLAVLSSALLLGLSGVATAGGSPKSWGIGAEYTLQNIGGASVNFDQGDFHAGAFLGYRSDAAPGDNLWTVDIGGRFWYHVHSTAMSDFSVGGALGLQLIDDGQGMDEDATIFTIDLGAQIRAFITSNVAVSLTTGFSIATADGEGEFLTGDFLGVGGVHYYFF